ncbi:MAG TPA: methylated-DNA--[protein]-cysteine S-methyltransferase [Acidimicrobiales bacterium]|nr:methylated-DNA--[protein]-cysteine S-methyltransferase [Acidimicrobiales bacterium]
MNTIPFLDVDPRDTGRRWWDDVPVKVGNARIGMVVVSDGEAITAIRFGHSKSGKSPVAESWVRDRKAVREAAEQLAEYGAGNLKEFDLPLRPSGTEFQMKVWAELTAIPYGTTTSYGRVADAIGRRGSGRAVGAAVGSNPIGIVIPCHRVIGADGALTGFGGGLDNKVALLRREGITAF